MPDLRTPVEAFDDPAQHFGTPAAVLEAADLETADKIAILERWRLDALRLSDSEQEGMGGGEPPHLGEIERLLLELKGD
jgi:hypothetical protein